MKHTRTIAAAALTVAVLGGATACGQSYNDHRGKGDAPVSGRRGDDKPADVTNFPDGFSNVATKCVAGATGYRAVVTTHTDSAAPALVVVADPKCNGR